MEDEFKQTDCTHHFAGMRHRVRKYEYDYSIMVEKLCIYTFCGKGWGGERRVMPYFGTTITAFQMREVELISTLLWKRNQLM
jgi:hypothetical protein